MSFIEIVETDESFELPIGDSVLVLRRADSEVYRKFEKKHTTEKKNPRTGVIFSKTDEYAVNDDLLDYMVLDWRGIKSPRTGEDVPCTRENKLKLPGAIKTRIIEACDTEAITVAEKNDGSGMPSSSTSSSE